MADHEFSITRIDGAYVAVCCCKRWRSNPYNKRADAETKGLMHQARGDNHNRALAQFQRGTTRLSSELRWYESQAEDLRNSPEDREMWKQLADDLRPRVEAQDPRPEDQQSLF